MARTPEDIRAYKKAWREKNKEKLRLQRIAWYAANKEKHDCRNEAWAKKNRGRSREIKKAWMDRNPERVLLHAAKGRARVKGVRFALSLDDINIPEKCPVFGTPIERGARRDHENAPSLDRTRPDLGYVKGNVAVISHRANMIKNCGSLDDHRRVVSYLESLNTIPLA